MYKMYNNKSAFFPTPHFQDRALGGWGVAVAVVAAIETFITWFVGCMACCWAPYVYEADKVSIYNIYSHYFLSIHYRYCDSYY